MTKTTTPAPRSDRRADRVRRPARATRRPEHANESFLAAIRPKDTVAVEDEGRRRTLQSADRKNGDLPTRAEQPVTSRTRRFRVDQRPSPDTDLEMLSLDQAAAIFWPNGPLTVASLRTAVRDGILDVAEIAGKVLTNRAALARMCVCRPRRSPATTPEPASEAPQRPSDRELLRAFKPE
ncbi:MAG: hypothetical protein HZA66_18875 [Rhodopseudomonas palustris]|uniref:Uncharacterized protein n=1 Tax=Rhodopseudomonas palustris TaxID=1076 RepID=A0A933S098_RHOPL|nr:hypothetical protein [Rhodopseudomonas palustris]